MTATIEEHAIGTVPMAAAEENGVRATLYGVLAHSFIAGPSAEMLGRIADAGQLIIDDASPLATQWSELRTLARVADAKIVCSEFDTVFVSTGRPPVSLYASSYMSGRQRSQLLAELRDDLMQAGYVRAEESTEYEDHLSALCDVMRGLILEESETVDGFEQQKLFFHNYLAPWYGRVCEAICQSEQTIFYRAVAKFANVFFTNESEYFELA